MFKRLLLVLPPLVLMFSTLAAQAAGPASPEVWLFLRSYNNKTWHEVEGQQAWDYLFKTANEPLPPFMNHVNVVAVSSTFNSPPDEVLRNAFVKLARSHIAFAIEAPAQDWTTLSHPCGKGVEGYTDPGTAAKIAARFKALGGELTYVTMEGPLSAGYYAKAAQACRSTIRDAAERAAAIMREYKKVFPDVVIGDVEPVPDMTKQPQWRQGFQQWRQEFQAVFGSPIAYLVVDVNWLEDQGHWQAPLTAVASYTRDSHLPLGIVFNAAFQEGARSDMQWLTRAEQNFVQVEKQLHIVPDKALFESWTPFPKRIFTNENGPGEDYLVKKYLQTHGIATQ